MKKIVNPLLPLFVAFALAACSASDPADPSSTEQHPVDARLTGDEQVVEITIGDAGYRPRQVQLHEGVPARLIFTRQSESSCAQQIQVPEFGVEPTDLPLHEPVAITFTPDHSGEFTFVCGMDMMRGTILVQS